ncbi:peptide-methionine (S)-S-oxide reductase MsrA [bacterium]|jgi:peptide-methionine (S)-S-oxide reductase|nr:peptide-methionine (S)-S-oxide reductase MsrA [bacterium]
MKEKAVFAAGCFWGIESAFKQVTGVENVVCGYCGGHKDSPTYQEVCSGQTGHAEAVEVTYDPEQVSFESLLNTFWSIHDPTTLHRQGPDIGTQYRSAIFFLDEVQKRTAIQSKDEWQKYGRTNGTIVTEITEASTFFKAEEYHQGYFEKHGISCKL